MRSLFQCNEAHMLFSDVFSVSGEASLDLGHFIGMKMTLLRNIFIHGVTIDVDTGKNTSYSRNIHIPLGIYPLLGMRPFQLHNTGRKIKFFPRAVSELKITLHVFSLGSSGGS